ncbi:hypothetical protein Tco_0929879 [Tanacetum coccineum]
MSTSTRHVDKGFGLQVGRVWWWCVAWDDDGRQWLLAGYGGVDDNDNVGGVVEWRGDDESPCLISSSQKCGKNDVRVIDESEVHRRTSFHPSLPSQN